MKRLLLASFVLAGVASAATFAGFSIKPYGNQRLNLQTGNTVLDKGGVATDAERGVTIDARFIEFNEGDWLRAQDAKLRTGEGGSLSAKNVEYDAKSATLTAEGNVTYNDGRVSGLSASSVTLDLGKNFAVARGGVRSTRPNMSANVVVVDYDARRAVMQGNVRYSFGGTRFASSRADAVLLVTWDANGKPSTNARPSADALRPYARFLR